MKYKNIAGEKLVENLLEPIYDESPSYELWRRRVAQVMGAITLLASTISILLALVDPNFPAVAVLAVASPLVLLSLVMWQNALKKESTYVPMKMYLTYACGLLPVAGWMSSGISFYAIYPMIFVTYLALSMTWARVYVGIMLMALALAPLYVPNYPVSLTWASLLVWSTMLIPVFEVLARSILNILQQLDEKQNELTASYSDLEASSRDMKELNGQLQTKYYELEVAQKDLKTEKSRSELVFNGAPTPILIRNQKGELQGFNPAAQKMAKNIGITFQVGDTKRLTDSAHANVRTQGDMSCDSNHEHSGPITDTGLLVVTGQSDEPTYYRRTTTWLANSRNCEKLQYMIFEDVTDIEIQRQKLDAANKSLIHARNQQREIMSIIGHEIRNPLSTASLLLDRPVERWATPNTPLKTLVNHAIELVDGLQLSGNLANSSLSHTHFSLTELVKSTAETHKERLESLGMSLRLKLPKDMLKVNFSYRHISQMISNLLVNACKHSEASNVVLTLNAERHNGTCRFTILVDDDGKGVERSERKKIFERYYRNRKADGSGLGLHICKMIVESASGELQCVKSPLGGARFELKFEAPLVDIEAPNRVSTSEVMQDLKVLVVEDQPVMRELTAERLEEEGAVVQVAEDGQEALEMLRDQGPGAFDIVLSDIMLPRLTGIELAHAISDEFPELPVIGITAATMGEERNSMLSAGAVACLVKPFQIEALTEHVTALSMAS